MESAGRLASFVLIGCFACGARTPPGSLRPPDAGTDAGALCALSADRPLATIATPALRIALDATHVYWTDTVALKRVPKSGGAVEEITRPVAAHFAIDETKAYFYQAVDHNTGSSHYVTYPLYWLPKTGGTAVLLRDNSVGTPGHLALDAMQVYRAVEYSRSVESVAKGTGQLTTLLATGIDAARLARSGFYLYFTTWLPGGVWRIPADGGKAEMLAMGDHSQDIAVDAEHVYWATYLARRSIRSVPIDGGPVAILVKPDGDPRGLALDDRHIYWAEPELGKVWRTPKSGGTSVPIVTGVASPTDVAVDDRCVYFAAANVIAGAPK